MESSHLVIFSTSGKFITKFNVLHFSETLFWTGARGRIPITLIDIQNAFDTIDHIILLEKMKCLSFSESMIMWFTSYHSNGSFILIVRQEFSSCEKLTCNVPRGSILGPLLFPLYVNDMLQAIRSELLLYDDDTYLFFTGKDSKTIEDQLNEDFNSFCEWFIDNKLTIHFGEGKTKSVPFRTKRLLYKEKLSRCLAAEKERKI